MLAMYLWKYWNNYLLCKKGTSQEVVVVDMEVVVVVEVVGLVEEVVVAVLVGVVEEDVPSADVKATICFFEV